MIKPQIRLSRKKFETYAFVVRASTEIKSNTVALMHPNPQKTLDFCIGPAFEKACTVVLNDTANPQSCASSAWFACVA